MAVPTAFDHRARTYSLPHAYCLAMAAELAYRDEEAVERQARAWGFPQVRHLRTAFTPPFPLADTQALAMAGDDMIVVAFRGTEPAQIRDWLSDATTPPWPGPAGTGFVHYGFAEALESVFPRLRDVLAELRSGGRSVWFTGHSLGGALAMLAAARLHLEEPHLTADGVITFGQPRTCDATLAAACNKAFRNRMYRFVNNNDVVPRLPLDPPFAHADAVRYIDSSGRVRESVGLLGGLADGARGMTADPLGFGDGLRDHSMRSYLAALERNLR